MKRVLEESMRLYNARLKNQFDSNIPLPEILSCRKSWYQQSFTEQFYELLEAGMPLNFDGMLGERQKKFMPMLDFMFHAVKRHKFFVTESGFCGMAHPDVREQVQADVRQGDYVVVAFGCHSPLLIRVPEGVLITSQAFHLPEPGGQVETLEMCRSTMNGRSLWFVGSCGIPAIANWEYVKESRKKIVYNLEMG